MMIIKEKMIDLPYGEFQCVTMCGGFRPSRGEKLPERCLPFQTLADEEIRVPPGIRIAKEKGKGEEGKGGRKRRRRRSH